MKIAGKIALWSFIGFVVFVTAHNTIFSIFKFEEWVFFSLSLLCGLVFVLSMVYVLVIFIVGKIKHKN